MHYPHPTERFMYNLHVQLPNVVRTGELNMDSLETDRSNVAVQDSSGVRTDLLKNKNRMPDKEDKLLKTQLLAARQKEIGEIRQLQLLIDKVYSEIKKHSEQELNYLQQVSTNVVTLAMAIANKIIFTKAETDQSFIAQVVNNTLKSTNNEQYFVIQINPEDKLNLEKYWDEILKDNNHLSRLAIEENISVGKGGCVIKTPNGTIDAQIENQLAIIEDALLQKYSGLVYEQR